MIPESAGPQSRLLVFLNYRREDSAGHAGRLYDDLAETFSPDQVFMDVDAIPPGAEFATSIGDAVGRSDALLALIGPRWLSAVGASGKRRIDDPDDLVRVEIEAALKRDILVVPILLQGARMPKSGDLPDGLKPLAKRNSLELRDARWRTDFEVLAQGLHRLAAEPKTGERGESAAFWTSGPADVELPYRGLRAFEEDDARFFFGRETDVEQLLSRLKERRFIAVFGPSGSGKSSLVRAGLVSALRHGALKGSDGWIVEVTRPGARPLDTIAAELVRSRPDDSMARMVDALATDHRTLHLETVRALADQPRDVRHVRVIDQAEELFTLCSDEGQRSAAIANLVHAATVDGGQAIVVLAMRADFYQRCAAYPALAAAISESQYLVSPLTEESLRRAIEEPARAVGLLFEPGLVDTIVKDVSAQPGALPLLEHALLELFQRRRGVTLTLEGYRAAGAVDGALATRAESVYGELPEAEQLLVRRVLLRLTQPGEGTEDTRRRSALRDLPSGASDADAVRHVVDELADARLLTLGVGEDSSEPVVEIAHEALLRAWPRVRGWIEQDREGLRIHRRLAEGVAEWERLGRTDDALLRGVRLAEASDWRARQPDLLNDAERSFVTASAEAANREHAARERRRRLTVFGAVGLSAVFVALSIVSFVAWRGSEAAFEGARAAESAANERADELAAQQVELERQRRVAIGRLLLTHAGRPDLPSSTSILLGLEARRFAGADANDQLLESLDRWGPLIGTVNGYQAPDEEQEYVVAYNFDLSLRVVGAGGELTFQDLRTGREHTLAGALAAEAPMFSPDGRTLFAATFDDQGRPAATLWDVESEQRTTLRATGPISSAAFSGDGAALVLVESEDRIVVWRTSETEPELVVPMSGRQVLSMALNGTGSILAIESATAVPEEDSDLRIDIWDVAGKSVRRLPDLPVGAAGDTGFGSPDIALSPIGDVLAIPRSDQGTTATVTLWDVGGVPRMLQTIELGPFAISDLDFSANALTLAAGGQDDTGGGVQILHPAGVGGDVASWWRTSVQTFYRFPGGTPSEVDVAPDSATVAAYSQVGFGALWAIRGTNPPETELTLDESMSDVLALGPGGSPALLFGHGDGAPGSSPFHVAVVDLPNGQSRGLGDRQPLSASIGLEGHIGAVATDEQVLIVDMESLQIRQAVNLAGVMEIAVSPDGTAIAVSVLTESVAGDFGWHTRVLTGERFEHEVSLAVAGVSQALAFSPDGRTLAIAGLEDPVTLAPRLELWDVAQHVRTAEISRRLSQQPRSIAFSRDGMTVVALGVRGGLVAWEVATGIVLSAGYVPFVEERPENAGAPWSPPSTFTLGVDGAKVASVGSSLHVWATGALLGPIEDRACAIAGRNLTREEWANYLPSEPYAPTCPQFAAG